MSSAAGAPTRRLPRWLLPAVGYSVSIACLVWVYHGFDWEQELTRLAATDWRWVTLAVIADVAVYFCMGARWSKLMSPLGNVSTWKTIQAVYIGLFANEVLPLRSGEVIRCYLQKNWTGIPLPVVISSVLIERLLDGVWLVLAFWFITIFVDLPAGVLILSQVPVILLVLAGAGLIYTTLRGNDISRNWPSWAKPLLSGIRVMGSAPSFLPATLLSLLYLVLQVIPIYALMRAYGLPLGPAEAAVVLVILRIGTIIPQLPGNVGSFQALVVLGLGLFGIAKAQAIGFATLLFVVVTLPLWLVGFVALMMTRMRLGEIHRDAKESFQNE
ncbi:MAG: lysylphosphatidylglycerol synthase transmembrane domain-containing protein [Bryobacteraceae bacterium]